VALNDEQRARILALALVVPRLWRDAVTPDRERKRMLRLIVEDVTLVKGKELTVHVRFQGGATRTPTLPRPAPAWALRQTSAEVSPRSTASWGTTPMSRSHACSRSGLSLRHGRTRGHHDGGARAGSLSPQAPL
jgi:hypothetical protein